MAAQQQQLDQERGGLWDKLKMPLAAAAGLTVGLLIPRTSEESLLDPARPELSVPAESKGEGNPSQTLTPIIEPSITRREPVLEAIPVQSDPIDALTLPCTDPEFRAELARVQERYMTALRKAINDCGFSSDVVPADLRERFVKDAADMLYEAFEQDPSTLGDVGAESVFDLRSQLNQLTLKEIRSRGILPIAPGSDPNVPDEYIYGAKRGESKPLRIATPEGEQLYLADQEGVYKVPPNVSAALLALWSAEEKLYELNLKGAFAAPQGGNK